VVEEEVSVRRVRLRAKLILVVMMTLVPIGGLSVWQGLANHKAMNALLDDQLVVGALALAQRERDNFMVAERSLLILSQNEDVRTMGSRCTDSLKPGLLAGIGVLNIVRSDASGTVRCSIAPFDPGQSLAGQQWWQDGIRRAAFSVSAPTIGPIVKKPVLIAMLPIFTAAGANDGAVSISIDFEQLDRSMGGELADKGDNAEMVVLAMGQVVATNSRAGALPQFKPDQAIGRVAEVTDADGVVWRYSAAPIFSSSLHAVHSRPKPKLLVRVSSMLLDNLLLPILAIVFTSLAIWIATHRLVVHWLESLIRLTNKFAAGEYGGDPAYFEDAPSEIAALSKHLHTMAGAVEQRDNELSAALLAKTNMTLEIHHRVKNNLQLVSSLLHMQSRQLTDPTARLSLDQARSRIGALSEIHRILYEGSNDSEQGEVNLRPLLVQLCYQLRVLHKHLGHIELTSDIQDYMVALDVAIPLSLFAVEAITNAYHHAYPRGNQGKIELACRVVENEILLSVTDQGIGFPQNHRAESMGSRLMNAFAYQLGGSFVVASNIGGGSQVTLRFPISPTNQDLPDEA
jgi:two-component sensor histidine kinase